MYKFSAWQGWENVMEIRRDIMWQARRASDRRQYGLQMLRLLLLRLIVRCLVHYKMPPYLFNKGCLETILGCWSSELEKVKRPGDIILAVELWFKNSGRMPTAMEIRELLPKGGLPRDFMKPNILYWGEVEHYRKIAERNAARLRKMDEGA